MLLLCSDIVLAQRARGAVQEDDRAARKQWEEDQRADEYATSLRRRDWLKDRLILQLGMGTKYPVMGSNWFGFGAGAEYITRWHASAFLTAGFIPGHKDPVFDAYELDGGMGWRVGLAYYLFPKNPIHLGFQVSYGTVFYDHEADPGMNDAGEILTTRSIIICRGYEFDVTISYLSDQWYFLQAIIGVYTIGNGKKDGGNSWGRTNDSWKYDILEQKYVSLVTTDSDNANQAIPPVGIVFGIGIGFAFEEFFPDETEIRRRERENSRSGKPVQGQRRPTVR
ncbi:MAG: hypothetical protein FWC26_10000 [Fibromonadales bacterium]|nr:hypothetical protein [Fibromonadales bacterium]